MHYYQGISLIEVIIGVAIVAIIAAIGLPNYQQYRLRSYRLQAATELLTVANHLEDYHLRHHTYAGTDIKKFIDPSIKHYQFALTLADARRFKLTAKPKGGQSQDRCGSLSINQLGQKSISGNAKLSQCWGKA